MANGHDAHLHHISQRFNAELKDLRDHVLVMGGMVEKQVAEAIDALVRLDAPLAEEVKANDRHVNRLETTIDEECTRVIAKRQPTAGDLRLVIAVTKMVNDLERIGDESKKIAKSTLQLIESGRLPEGAVEVRMIGEHVSRMLRQSLDAFTRFDINVAYEVIKEDRIVDSEYKTAMRSLVTAMMEDSRNISPILNIMWVLRALERVGDHARNICQHVIYMVHGKDVRHATVEQTEEIISSSR